MTGPLTFGTVAAQLKQTDGSVGDRLDLAACPRIDSAGAAYLLEMTRRARSRGAQMRLLNANQQIKNLLHFFQLDKIVLVD